jgi:hypothetical protein
MHSVTAVRATWRARIGHRPGAPSASPLHAAPESEQRQSKQDGAGQPQQRLQQLAQAVSFTGSSVSEIVERKA